MAVFIPSRHAGPDRTTLVFQFFDPRLFERLWFIAFSDGTSVQLMTPTFQTEQAAHLFERRIVEDPAGSMLSIDGQLELARRIEAELSGGG